MRRQSLIEKLEKELEIVKSRHESAIQEIGRLESRIQTQQVDSKNDNEILNSEVLSFLKNNNLTFQN